MNANVGSTVIDPVRVVFECRNAEGGVGTCSFTVSRARANAIITEMSDTIDAQHTGAAPNPFLGCSFRFIVEPYDAINDNLIRNRAAAAVGAEAL